MLHVWTLSGDKYVGTVHIKFLNPEEDQTKKFNEVSLVLSSIV